MKNHTSQAAAVFSNKELEVISQMFADVYNSGLMTAHQATVAVKVEKTLRGATAALLGDVQAYMDIMNS